MKLLFEVSNNVFARSFDYSDQGWMMMQVWLIFYDKIVVTSWHWNQIQRGIILQNSPPPPVAVPADDPPTAAVVPTNDDAWEEEEELSFVISDVSAVTVVDDAAATASGMDG